MTVRDRCLAPLASGRPAAQASHLRSCTGLVNEDEFCRINLQTKPPVRPLRRGAAVRPRAPSFFVRDPPAIEEAPQRADAEVLAALIRKPHLQLGKRHIGLTCDDIEVTGRVPDVAPYLDAADVVICPLRYGGGVKVKMRH